jgi:hypothetical protein
MAFSTVKDIKNLWGSEGSSLEPQRTDLWALNFSSVHTKHLRDRVPKVLPPYFPTAFSPPERRILPEPYRENNQAVMRPGYDVPLGLFRVTFILDAPILGDFSVVQDFIDAWYSLVQSGREMSFNGRKSTFVLNSDYTFPQYEFDIVLCLLRGLKPFEMEKFNALQQVAYANRQNQSTVNNTASALSGSHSLDVSLRHEGSGQPESVYGLPVSSYYLIKGAWPFTQKLSELTYEGSRVATLEVDFAARDFGVAKPIGLPEVLVDGVKEEFDAISDSRSTGQINSQFGNIA